LMILVDFHIVLQRPGGRVSKRKRCRSTIGHNHRIQREEAIEWFAKKYEIVLIP
jgi:large subunit ribosomal protein L11e